MSSRSGGKRRREWRMWHTRTDSLERVKRVACALIRSAGFQPNAIKESRVVVPDKSI